MVVDTDTVELCVSIEEHAELQQWIRAVFDTWYHGTWREGSLVDISVVVLRILGHMQFAELLQLYFVVSQDKLHKDHGGHG